MALVALYGLWEATSVFDNLEVERPSDAHPVAQALDDRIDPGGHHQQGALQAGKAPSARACAASPIVAVFYPRGARASCASMRRFPPGVRGPGVGSWPAGGRAAGMSVSR